MATQPCRTRRPRLLWVALTLLATIALVWLWLEWFVYLPDLSAIRHVKPGMTEAEVIHIFGARPTTITPRQVIGRDRLKSPDPNESKRWVRKYWNCDAGIAEVYFGPNGRVIFAGHEPYSMRPSALRLKLRGFLSTVGLGWLGV